MNQTQLVRVDARTARRALKLVRAQLALLPSATMPLALSVPHLTLPALPNASLQSLLAISMAISSSLASTVTSSLSTNPFSISTLRPSLTALSRSLHSLSPSALIFPSLPTIEIDVALLHNLITRLLELAHTRLPRILTRAIPTDPAILKSTVEKLAFTQTRAYAIRYGIQVALSFALRLLPEVERSLPVPLRLTLSLTRLLVRQVVGQVVRVVVGVLVRQVILARKGQVGLGKGAVRIMKAAAKVVSLLFAVEMLTIALSCWNSVAEHVAWDMCSEIASSPIPFGAVRGQPLACPDQIQG